MSALPRSAFYLPALLVIGCVGEPGDLPVYEDDAPLSFESSFGLAEGEVTVEGGSFHQGDNALLVSVHAPGQAEAPPLVAAHAFMPAHSHGTEPPRLHESAGVYRVERLNLFMAGRWEITLEFESGNTIDDFVFAANVQ